MITKQINPTTACFPGKPLESSLHLLNNNYPKDSLIENWDFSNIQLCPQNPGFISINKAESLTSKYPNTQFRLHANVRLFLKHQQFDSNFSLNDDLSYAEQLKTINNIINGKVYSYHAPMKTDKTWNNIIDNVLKLQDFLNIPVALEGLYPNKKISGDFWQDTFNNYSTILKSDIFYALDLSHINILYEQSDEKLKKRIILLTKDMIEYKNCLEVHISDNDGVHDSHKIIKEKKWWVDILNNSTLPPNCLIFCESNQN